MKPTLRLSALVFAGGALGAILRFLVDVAVNRVVVDQNFFAISLGWFAQSNSGIFDPAKPATISLAGIITLTLVNSLGSASLGWSNGDRRFADENLKAFWSVGFAGGFTTMSGLFVWLVFTNQLTAELTLIALAGSVILSGLSYVMALKIAAKKVV